MSRLVVVLPLQPLRVGDGFSLSGWPLHVTVAPTFVVTAPQVWNPDLRAVADTIHPILRTQPALRVRVGPDEGFGRSGKIPVSVVEPTPELTDLHTGS